MLWSAVAIGLASAWLIAATPALAEPLAPKDVPEPLRPWIDWVLREVPFASCPYRVDSPADLLRSGAPDSRPCIWPSKVELIVDDRGAAFRQSVTVYRDAWVPVPGDATWWPEEVQLDGVPAAVIAGAASAQDAASRSATPIVRVPKGTHRILGRIRWDSIPESLPIPAEAGIARIELTGQALARPLRPVPGLIRFERTQQPTPEAERLEVRVHRRLTDGIPALLETRLSLDVAGSAREVVIGGVLPDGFRPLSIQSALEARVDASGALRMAVRAGRHELTLTARSRERALEVGYPQVSGPWDATEIWSFRSDPELRWAEIEGVPAIDPQQTEMPREWREAPAYLLEQGGRLRLVERRRTGSEPIPDRLLLRRTLWLDFDGSGYTLQDRISGALGRSYRLEVDPRLELGRAAIGGLDQPITRLRAEAAEGIELRVAALDLEADLRIGAPPAADGAESRPAADDLRHLPVVGWSGDFLDARAELRLPPGWTALHVSGPDKVLGSWVDGWSLLELFLVLITALAIGQLFGYGLGVGAGVALALCFQEPGAPRFIWLVALAGLGLSRVAPEGRLRKLATVSRVGVALVLAVIAIPFAVQQAQRALYPALEMPHMRAGSTDAPRATRAMSERAAEPERRRELMDLSTAEQAGAQPAPAAPSSVAPSEAALSTLRVMKAIDDFDRPDPNALASTGMGVPDWQWREVSLSWSGPLTAGESFRPYLVPPWMNRLLAVLRVLAVAMLAVLTLVGAEPLRAAVRRLRDRVPTGSTPLWIGAFAAGAGLWLTPQPAAADYPSRAQLEELRERLTEPPSCVPSCATLTRMRLEIEPTQLRARLELDVAAASAVPLPGSLESFVPRQVTVGSDDQPSLVRDSGGTLLLSLDPGRHQVLLVGELGPRDSIEIPLQLAPRRIEVASQGWRVSGVRAGERVTRSIKLDREASSEPQDGSPGQEPVASSGSGSGIPGFVRVTRLLRLGLSWQVVTTVERLSPLGQPLVLGIPLLAGETVIDGGVEVRDGRAELSLDPSTRRTSWVSNLEPISPIVLRAPDDVAWLEAWQVDAASTWHLETSGIPPTGTQRQRSRTFLPWPGESVELALIRPEPAGGQSITLDESRLRVEPGARASESSLSLTLRASRAERYRLALPEGAELSEIAIDARPSPLRPIDGVLEVPLRPGAQQLEVTWQVPMERGAVYATPRLDLGLPGVNVNLLLNVPDDRWVLWVGGPTLGPAVRFWGLLAVAALLAFGLARSQLTPLGAGSWFLLFVGLTQTEIAAAILIVVWLLALGVRRQRPPEHPLLFDGVQLGLALLSLLALGALIDAIGNGLLGSPEMQVVGNGSSGSDLRWYQDRSGPVPERGWVLWVPIWVYRLAMLAWALWIAQALLRWLRWGWESVSHEGLWRNLRAG